MIMSSYQAEEIESQLPQLLKMDWAHFYSKNLLLINPVILEEPQAAAVLVIAQVRVV